ncbi:MAG: hypothetical protein JNM63_08005 [Spirochaetia bacterium]|nr:hypothetical protein [Spirochaetia bacterium]
MKIILHCFILLCVTASFVYAQKIADDFSALDTKVWAWKDNVKASLFDSSDSERTKVLKIASDFSKFTYAWVSRKLPVGSCAPEKATGLRFFTMREGLQDLTVVLFFMNGETQVKYEAQVTPQQAWSEFVVPFSLFKQSGKSISDSELARVEGVMFVTGKKTEASATLYLDDFSVIAK